MDPFDFSTTDPQAPGLFGLPIGTWQDLARFGGNLAAAANARTASGHLANGTGLAGSLGAATVASMDQGRQNAVTRSELAQRGQQTRGLGLQNQLLELGLPFEKRMADLRQRALESDNGGGQPTPLGYGVGPQSSGNATSVPGGIPLDQRAALISQANEGLAVPAAVHYGLIDYETGGKWQPQIASPNSSAKGLPQALASTAANPGYGVPPIDIANASPLDQAKWAGQYLQGRGHAAGVTDWNDPVQVTKALIAYHGPEKDANGIDGAMYAQQVLRRAAQYGGQAGSRAEGAPPPYQVASTGPVAPPDGSAPAQGTQMAQAGPRQQGAQPQSGQSEITPQQYRARAAFLNEQAKRADLYGKYGPGLIGDPAMMRQEALANIKSALELETVAPLERAKRAEELRTASPMAQAQAWGRLGAELEAKGYRLNPDGTQTRIPGGAADPAVVGEQEAAKATAEAMANRLRFISTRSGIYDPLANKGKGGEAYRQPEFETMYSPSSGRGYAAYVETTPDGEIKITGGPPDLKPGEIPLTKLGPGETTAMTHAAEDAFGEKARAQYAAAQGTKRSMRDLERQFEVLNSQGPGWYNTGAGAEWKLDIGRAINAATATVGAAPIFNPDKIAAGEDILKQSKLAGMDVLAQHFGGSREAASIISGTQKAVPNIENTPLGGMLMLNGYKEAANWVSNQHAFMANWSILHDGNMVGADVAFAQSHPAEKYQDRAISQVRPFAVASFDQAKDFLPGTVLILKGGDPTKKKVVPGDTEVKFIDPRNPQGTLNGQ